MKERMMVLNKFSFPFVIMAAMLLAAGVGCGPGIPEYIGTWIVEDDFTFDTITVSARITLVLNEDGSFAMYQEMKNTETGEYEYLQGNESVTGTFEVDGETVTLTITKKEFLNDEWQQELETPEITTSRYEIHENQLTIYTDNNEDGDTDDEMETLTFSRAG